MSRQTKLKILAFFAVSIMITWGKYVIVIG